MPGIAAAKDIVLTRGWLSAAAPAFQASGSAAKGRIEVADGPEDKGPPSLEAEANTPQWLVLAVDID